MNAGPKGSNVRSKRESKRSGPGSAKSQSDELDFGLLPDLVGYNLRRAQSAVFRHFAETVSSHDVSPGHFGVLVIIEANPGMNQTTLAGALNVDRSSIVPVIDHLEDAGLVTRQKKPSDRRTHELHLTDYGATRLRALKTAVLKHEEEVAGCLSEGQKNDLIETLAKIRDRLD